MTALTTRYFWQSLNINYGRRGKAKEWLESYPSDRKQYVLLNGSYSSPVCSESRGVLQGFVLGSLMFIVFINDLSSSSNFLNPKPQIFTCVETINRELNHIYSWTLANKIKVNIQKTKYILFSYGCSTAIPEIKL